MESMSAAKKIHDEVNIIQRHIAARLFDDGIDTSGGEVVFRCSGTLQGRDQ